MYKAILILDNLFCSDSNFRLIESTFFGGFNVTEHHIVNTGVLKTLHYISAFKFFEIMISKS